MCSNNCEPPQVYHKVSVNIIYVDKIIATHLIFTHDHMLEEEETCLIMISATLKMLLHLIAYLTGADPEGAEMNLHKIHIKLS